MYSKSLENRGNISFWVTEDALVKGCAAGFVEKVISSLDSEDFLYREVDSS